MSRRPWQRPIPLADCPGQSSQRSLDSARLSRDYRRHVGRRHRHPANLAASGAAAGSVRPILASALLTFAAIALYAVATLHGQLAIVSVLSSLYPVAPVLLARYTLGERVHRVQQLGIAAMLAGVVLLST